jgi:hypothetical protein
MPSDKHCAAFTEILHRNFTMSRATVVPSHILRPGKNNLAFLQFDYQLFPRASVTSEKAVPPPDFPGARVRFLRRGYGPPKQAHETMSG